MDSELQYNFLNTELLDDMNGYKRVNDKRVGTISKPLFRVYYISFLTAFVFILLYFFRCYSVGIAWSIAGIMALLIGCNSIAYVICKKKYVAGNIFLITWELGFFLSLFKLSTRQFIYDEKICFYIFIIGIVPVTLEKVIFGNRKGLFEEKGAELLRPLLFTNIFMALSLITFILILRRYGIFATQGERVSINDNGSWMNVACVVFIRICFCVASYLYITKKDKSVLPAMAWCLTYCILTMTRSLLISFAVYYLILIIVNKKIKVSRLIIVLFIIILVFGFLGNVREGSSFSIAEYSGVDGINAFGWLYSYLCVNYDNLALQITKGHPTYTLSFFLRPIITLFDLRFSWFDDSYLYVGHLNLGTFYRDYVCDLGEYAILPFAFTMVILLMIVYSKNKGGYISIAKYVIFSELALAPLTNHFTQSPAWLVILFCFCMQIATSILSRKKNKKI